MAYNRAIFKNKSENLNGTVRLTCTKCKCDVITTNKVNATKNLFTNIKMTFH